MKLFSSHETLQMIISILLNYLEELNGIKSSDENQFAYGEKTAYTECLELIQLWEKAHVNGLNFNIEERYPL